jgi:hypothetical protein
MVALGLLVVLVVAIVAFGATRLHAHAPAAGSVGGAGVHDDRLDEWVTAGLVTADQARSIRAYEHDRVPDRPPARVSPGVEALAYVGGILLAVGAGMLIARLWHGLGVGGRIGVLAGAATLVVVVGTVVGESDGVTWRLRGFLWALGTVGFAAVAGIFVVEVLKVTGEAVGVTVAGTTAVVSAGLWQLRNRPLQHALTLLGLAIALGTGIAWAQGPGAHGLLIGLALWLVGGMWAWLGWRDRIPPAALGFLLGVVLTLVGSGIVNAQVSWLAPLLGLATAGAWVAVGVVRSERVALAPGLVGVFVFLPWTLARFFGGTVGAPVVAMVSGALLLGVVLLLVRRGRDGHGDPGRGGPTRWRASAYGAGP